MHLALGSSCVPCSGNVCVTCSRYRRVLCCGIGSVPHCCSEQNKDEQEELIDISNANWWLIVDDQLNVWQVNKQWHEDKEEEE